MKRIVLTLILTATGLLAQTATTIYDIQSGAVAVDTEVQIKGVVTAGSGETPDGSTAFYVQDGTGAYSGINVFATGYSVSRGDSVDLTGTYAEYYGKSEIKDVTALTVINSGNALPAAEVLTLNQSDWELWEGVLIQVQNVSVLDPDEGYGEWSVTDGTDTLYINNAGSYTYVPAAGDQFVSITGPLNYSYGNYKLIPRDDRDIVVIGPPRISNLAITPSSPVDGEDVTVSATILDDGTFSAEVVYDAGSGEVNVAMSNVSGDSYEGVVPGQAAGTTVTYFVTATDNDANTGYSDTLSYVVLSAGGVITPIADVQDTSGTAFAADTSSLYGQEVTISGIVTAEFWGSSSNRYLFVQDAEGPWNGILVFEYGGWDNFAFQSSEGVVNSVAEGDSVTLTGTVDEYKGMTEITDVTEFIIHGPAVNMISPAAVTPGQIMTGGTDAEAYEGCLVGVSDVTVDNPDLGYGEWSVTDGTNSVRVDDKWDYFYWPAQDQALAEVVGCLDYTYGDTKIQPRLARDVVEKGAVRIQRIQQVLYSDLLKAGFDEESDMSYMVGDTVTVVGIV
ncbi:MAG: hypothetical protein GXO90_12010, partial [FCB group bacterium]|nr:hypothetical protein [FCB group bacterium]